MGGEQAANVLAAIRRGGERAAQEAGERCADSLREQYARQSSPYYATARLWDDGILDPRATRSVLARALAIARFAPTGETRFGVFRM